MKHPHIGTIAGILDKSNDVSDGNFNSLTENEFLAVAAHAIFLYINDSYTFPILLNDFPCIHKNREQLERAIRERARANGLKEREMNRIESIGGYFVAVPERAGSRYRLTRACQLLAYCEAQK